MRYRSRTDIVSQILEAANGGATKTKIMYKAYLSYQQLKEYLTMMVESDLIEYLPSDSKYKTTEKGLRYQHMYDQMSNITGEMRAIPV
jgi:predicted transcriptional regulator